MGHVSSSLCGCTRRLGIHIMGRTSKRSNSIGSIRGERSLRTTSHIVLTPQAKRNRRLCGSVGDFQRDVIGVLASRTRGGVVTSGLSARIPGGINALKGG